MTGFKGADAAETPPANAVGRGVTFLGYGLLLLALPTLGTSALLALILAYARRDGAGVLIRSHCRFQIRIFWTGLGLTAAAAALGMSALMGAARSPPPVHVPVSPHAQLVAYTSDPPDRTAQPAAVEGFAYSFGARGLVWSTRAILEGYASVVLLVFAGLWGLGAPLYGAARLASGRAMGHSPG